MARTIRVRSKFFKVVESHITFYMGEEGEESEQPVSTARTAGIGQN
jgi:hypothetical protein